MGRSKKRRSLVTLRPGRPHYYENFSVKGHRFRDCLGTDDEDEAEALAAARRADALIGKITGRKSEISLSQALGRYWIERGQHAATADEIKRFGRILMQGLAGDTRLSSLDFGSLSALMASRRVRRVGDRFVDRANATVNREMEHLRTVIIACKDWGYSVPEIDWRKLWLDEPENRQTILTAAKEADFFAELRPDYHPLVQFALISGVRLENAIRLRWQQIDWDAKSITFRTKSRKPGRHLHMLPLTRDLAAILGRERGHHPELVFTYVCQRNRHDPHSGLMQVKGGRYPFTHDGWRKEWLRVRAAVGLFDLRFHDLRHTAGTRALAAARGNLKTVQKQLGHADISSTVRYLASDIEDVRAAMEAAAAPNRHRLLPSKRISSRKRGA